MKKASLPPITTRSSELVRKPTMQISSAYIARSRTVFTRITPLPVTRRLFFASKRPTRLFPARPGAHSITFYGRAAEARRGFGCAAVNSSMVSPARKIAGWPCFVSSIARGSAAMTRPRLPSSIWNNRLDGPAKKSLPPFGICAKSSGQPSANPPPTVSPFRVLISSRASWKSGWNFAPSQQYAITVCPLNWKIRQTSAIKTRCR